MYICLCNEVTERQIHAAAAEGATSLCDLQRCLGVATNCGRCQPYAVDVLDEALRQRNASTMCVNN